MVIPIITIFLIPNQFIYSSPFSLSLIMAMVATCFLYLYYKNKNNYYFALISSITAVVIHPFVGLNILVWVIFSPLILKSTNKIKQKLYTLFCFIFSSTITVFCFIAYNWLQNKTIYLMDPVYYLNKFLAIFNDPIWYFKDSSNLIFDIIYIFEKIHFFLVLLIVLIYIILKKPKEKTNIMVLLISISYLLSAWLFLSSIEVSGYTFGDQINYSFRLLQVTKWILWPLLLLIFINFFIFLKKRNKIFQYFSIVLISIIITICWYLTYPRNDVISRLNVNNIREIDYKAIDYIYNREGGKDDYIVLANQIFGAGAVNRYGFGPYYESDWGNLLYYSLPMDSELNKIYESIMTSKSFENENIDKIFNKIDVDKIYFIETNYWPLYTNTAKEINKEAINKWNFNNDINLYLFSKK